MTSTAQLVFHTDIRSLKVPHLAACSNVSVCWYGQRTRDQFRFEGTGKVYHPLHSNFTQEMSEMRDLEWSRSSDSGKLSYGVEIKPGTEIDDVKKETEDESIDLEFAYNNFAIILVDVECCDFLCLKRPQSRITFKGMADGLNVQP